MIISPELAGHSLPRGIYSNKCAAKRRGINWLKVISVEGNKALIGWLKNSCYKIKNGCK